MTGQTVYQCPYITNYDGGTILGKFPCKVDLPGKKISVSLLSINPVYSTRTTYGTTFRAIVSKYHPNSTVATSTTEINLRKCSFTGLIVLESTYDLLYDAVTNLTVDTTTSANTTVETTI